MSLPPESVDATIVVGAANHNKKALESLCEGADNLALVTEVSNMAELFAQADLAIGAGGTTTWERCAVGLPSILVTLAENQRSNCERAQELGAALHLGAAETLTQAAMSAAIEQLLNDTELWKQMSENAAQLVDGQGSQRVIEAILKDS
jgi:UDP-2,4-diacetamido-2,4,6-trideoxy-beta-L-altropyranose hydrolase